MVSFGSGSKAEEKFGKTFKIAKKLWINSTQTKSTLDLTVIRANTGNFLTVIKLLDFYFRIRQTFSYTDIRK